MNRRIFLSSSAGAIACFAGCLDSSSDGGSINQHWPPEVESNEPEASPGTNATARVEYDRISAFEVRSGENTAYEGMSESAPVMIGTPEITPSPDRFEDSMPPVPQWDSPVSATLAFPIQVADDAEAGQYTFSVRVYEGQDSSPTGGDSSTDEFGVTVTRS